MDGGHDRGGDGLLLGLDRQEILVLVRLDELTILDVATVVVGGAAATAEYVVIVRSGDIDLARYGRCALLHGRGCGCFDSAHGAGALRGFEKRRRRGGVRERRWSSREPSASGGRCEKKVEPN